MKLCRSIAIALVSATIFATTVQAQRASLPGPAATAPHRTRLFLKDGSYQVVLSYTVSGSRVRFVSAERDGETEEIPLELVDLAATKKWEQQHSAPDPKAPAPPPVLDPELVREEADRAAITPEVAPDLRLAAEDSVLAFDTFHATPELVPLNQAESDLNKQTGHGIFRQKINPAAAAHEILVIKGEKADVQMHVDQPALYVRLDEAIPSSGEALTVDTHGASAAADTRKERTGKSDYVIVRLDVRQDARVVTSVNLATLGTPRQQTDVFETDVTDLPAGHWVRIVPKQPLLIGEYALLEILNDRELNLGVWDFGVHPTAPENREAIRPEKRRPSTLERRPRQ